jgi:hypothetical protein
MLCAARMGIYMLTRMADENPCVTDATDGIQHEYTFVDA